MASSSEPISESVSVDGSEKETEPEAANGKTLVVYYFASGYTGTVIRYIAEVANADIFEIEPVNVYTDADLDWINQEGRVVYKYDNPDARDVELVSTEVADWNFYDTVFIGYST